MRSLFPASLFFACTMALFPSFAMGAAAPAAQEKPPLRDLSGQMMADDADMRAALQTGKTKGTSKGAKVRRSFDQCDTNGDGLLSSFEFRNCFPRSGAKFMVIDYNKDNKVSREEIERYLAEPKVAKARKPDLTAEERKAVREEKKEQRKKAQQQRRSRPMPKQQ